MEKQSTNSLDTCQKSDNWKLEEIGINPRTTSDLMHYFDENELKYLKLQKSLFLTDCI